MLAESNDVMTVNNPYYTCNKFSDAYSVISVTKHVPKTSAVFLFIYILVHQDGKGICEGDITYLSIQVRRHNHA